MCVRVNSQNYSGILQRMWSCIFATRGSSANKLRLKSYREAAIPAEEAGILQISWGDEEGQGNGNFLMLFLSRRHL